MVTTPSIHLNGTSREALSAQYEAAYRALTAALTAVSDAGPNARDYYVQGSTAFARAVEEHRARLAAIAAVRADMLALYDSVQE